MVGKMLVRRIERSRRYAVDPRGLRTLCAYLLLRDKACPREGGDSDRSISLSIK
jgi:hypothetical protein